MSNATTAAPLPPPSAAPETGSIISTRDLTKTFGDQTALDGINLEIPPGQIVGVIGPSGCGKTTLVRHLIGILSPTSGEVRVFGTDPTQFSVRQRTRFGYMPQLPVLFPNLTIWGNLNFIASVYGVPIRRRKEHLLQLLDLVDLREHRSKQLADCSGGMQRRLALAATLVHDPELLYLDEPTAGVDPILRERFWTHFRMLRDQGQTIVVPTQYVGEAVSCDLVAVMATGRIITVQPPSRLARFAYGGDPLLIPFDEGWGSQADVRRVQALPFVRSTDRIGDGVIVIVDDAEEAIAAFAAANEPGIDASTVVPHEPSFDDIFVKIVETHDPKVSAAA